MLSDVIQQVHAEKNQIKTITHSRTSKWLLKVAILHQFYKIIKNYKT